MSKCRTQELIDKFRSDGHEDVADALEFVVGKTGGPVALMGLCTELSRAAYSDYRELEKDTLDDIKRALSGHEEEEKKPPFSLNFEELMRKFRESNN